MSSNIAEEVTVVLLPGLDGTGRLFEPFSALCPRGFRVQPIAYPSDKPASVGELVQHVQSLLPSGRWLLLAESFSGVVAIQLAASKPAGLRGVVLVATAAKWSRLRWLRSAPLATLFALQPPTAFLRCLLLGDAPADLVSATRKAVGSVAPSVLAARLRELAVIDARPLLAEITVPLLYLQARHDRLARRAELRSVQSSGAQVDVRVVDGPHFLVQSAPAAVWQHLVAFEQSLRAA